MSIRSQMSIQGHFEGETVGNTVLAQCNNPPLILFKPWYGAFHSLILLKLGFGCQSWIQDIEKKPALFFLLTLIPVKKYSYNLRLSQQPSREEKRSLGSGVQRKMQTKLMVGALSTDRKPDQKRKFRYRSFHTNKVCPCQQQLFNLQHSSITPSF